MDERTIVLGVLLKMQQSLNDETNGLGWENGYTNKNKLIKLEALHIYGVR